MKYILILILLIVISDVANCNNIEDQKPAEVSVVPNDAVFKIKDDYYFGLKFTMKKGWKTYWKNPGDAGLPLSIEVLEDDSEIKTEILFPFPNRFFDDDILTIGYENEVLFPIKIISKNFRKIITTIKIDYLVCKDICIPISEKKKINLNLDNIQNSNYFEEFYKTVPKKGNSKFSIIKRENIDKNSLKFEIKTNNDLTIKDIFLFSSESTLTLEKNKKINNDLNIIKSEKNLSELSQPILISLSDGNDFFEIPFDIKKESKGNNFLWFYLLAFIGGMILNFMPCVLPVLSLKLLTFSSLIKSQPNEIKKASLFTILGIIFSFILLGIFIVLLKNIGTEVGWGFHFQNQYFIIFITIITLIFSLNLLGLFEIVLPQKLNQYLYNFTNNNKKFSHFFTGIFSTLMATPCSAPFLGTAVGFSMVGSTYIIMTIFLAISLGFATPYICFLIFPNMIKILPKPGNWMTNFKIFLGLLLLLTLAWLLSLLKINVFLILLLIISLTIVSVARKKITNKLYFTSATILIFILLLFYNNNDKKLKWENFSIRLLESYIKNNDLIFVDVTADWCITCQLNKLTTLESGTVSKLFVEKNVKLLRADWTNRNESILEFISKHDRYGIPLNVIYYKNNKDGILLPEILSQDIVLEKINEVLNEN